MTNSFEEYNWHPAVHKRFGEDLRFYLIRFREPRHTPIAQQIREILERADIRFACEYSVFGSWDALIRVWLNAESHHRFVQRLNESQSNVAVVRHMTVEKLQYLWTGSDDDFLASDAGIREQIADRLEDIRSAVAVFPDLSPSLQRSLMGDEDGVELAGAPLLLKRKDPSTAPGAVKFYIAFSHAGGDLADEGDDSRRLLAALHELKLGERTTVYTGSGRLADYLVRCVADTYHDVLTLTAALDQRLTGTSLAPVTFLIADLNPRESDNVNHLEALSYDDAANIELLHLDDKSKALTELPSMQRLALNGLVRTAYELSRDDSLFRDRLRSLLKACIEEDHQAFGGALTFLIELEFLVGEYVKRAWADVYRRNWISELSALFESVGDERSALLVRSPEEWTLGSTVHMAKSAAKNDADVNVRFNQQLGSKWRDQMTSTVDLRNAFAHGRLRRLERLNDFAGETGQLLVGLLEAATLHHRCISLTTTSIG